MASWIVVPCLEQLRAEFNEIAPDRDKASDGSIGDALHSSSSDHTPDEISDALRGRDSDKRNEVHARDFDVDLRVPGLTMEMVVQHVLRRCRSGAERRLGYIIFNRRIWSASAGWAQRTYTGPNAHDKHAHFSASYDTAREASTASWHLEDIPVALTASDKQWFSAEISKAVGVAAREAVAELVEPTKLNGPDGKPDGTQSTKIGHAVLSQGIPNPIEGGRRTAAHKVLADMTASVVDVEKLAELIKAAVTKAPNAGQ